jgi:hypothetical protein
MYYVMTGKFWFIKDEEMFYLIMMNRPNADTSARRVRNYLLGFNKDASTRRKQTV